MLLFNSGYYVNFGILFVLMMMKSLILVDKFVYVSMIDGICLSWCVFFCYCYNDYEYLKNLFEKNVGKFDCIFIVIEFVFSMDGDVVDLK